MKKVDSVENMPVFTGKEGRFILLMAKMMRGFDPSSLWYKLWNITKLEEKASSKEEAEELSDILNHLVDLNIFEVLNDKLPMPNKFRFTEFGLKILDQLEKEPLYLPST